MTLSGEGRKSVELDGLSYKTLRVAWTDLGEGAPVILLHGIPTWSFLYNEVIPLLAETAGSSRQIFSATAIPTDATSSTAPCSLRRP